MSGYLLATESDRYECLRCSSVCGIETFILESRTILSRIRCHGLRLAASEQFDYVTRITVCTCLLHYLCHVIISYRFPEGHGFLVVKRHSLLVTMWFMLLASNMFNRPLHYL